MTSYYKPDNWSLVDIEEELKAEHALELVRGIQFCATVTELADASSPSKNGFLMAFVLLLCLVVRRRF
jgi:hypothetical protein